MTSTSSWDSFLCLTESGLRQIVMGKLIFYFSQKDNLYGSLEHVEYLGILSEGTAAYPSDSHVDFHEKQFRRTPIT